VQHECLLSSIEPRCLTGYEWSELLISHFCYVYRASCRLEGLRKFGPLAAKEEEQISLSKYVYTDWKIAHLKRENQWRIYMQTRNSFIFRNYHSKYIFFCYLMLSAQF